MPCEMASKQALAPAQGCYFNYRAYKGAPSRPLQEKSAFCQEGAIALSVQEQNRIEYFS